MTGEQPGGQRTVDQGLDPQHTDQRHDTGKNAIAILAERIDAIRAPHLGWAIGSVRNNPSAEVEIGRLLAQWRNQGWRVQLEWHGSTNLKSHYRPGQPGNDFKAEVGPIDGEPMIPERVNDAFISFNHVDLQRDNRRPP
jgi:hypothetical protein